MDHIFHLNRAIDYMEAHLTQSVAIAQVAASVGYSRFHFDRLFLAVVGDTPTGYLRKRRLTEAAREIVGSRKSLLEIALDYQFQSQEAFTRSFKRMFALSPGAYRRRRRLNRTFYKITLRPQKLFYWNGGHQAAKLILPRPGIVKPWPTQTIVLATRSATHRMFRQEIHHAYHFAPTQFYLALGGPSYLRDRGMDPVDRPPFLRL